MRRKSRRRAPKSRHPLKKKTPIRASRDPSRRARSAKNKQRLPYRVVRIKTRGRIFLHKKTKKIVSEKYARRHKKFVLKKKIPKTKLAYYSKITGRRIKKEQTDKNRERQGLKELFPKSSPTSRRNIFGTVKYIAETQFDSPDEFILLKDGYRDLLSYMRERAPAMLPKNLRR